MSASRERVCKSQQLTWDRYFYEEVSKRSAIKTAQREMNQTETTLKMYEIRSAIPGVVKTIYKNRGDAVKKLEAKKHEPTPVPVDLYGPTRPDLVGS